MSVVRMRIAAFAICVFVAGTQAAQAQPAPVAVEQFQTYQATLAKDAKAQDWAAYLIDAKRLKAFLNDAPTSRLEVARAHLRLGERDAALAETQAFLALGQTNAILSSPLFEPIAKAIGAHVAANEIAVAHARRAFVLPGPAMLPEDIDFDPLTKRFFLTAVLGRKIVSVDFDGAQQPFAESPDGWPMVALKIDAKRRRLWATEVAFNDFQTIAAADRGRSVLLEYDLDSARVVNRIEGPAHAALGDMALATDGEPIVSDGEGGGVYRADHGSLRRIDHGEFVSPQTPAFCGDPKVVFIPDYVRGLARLELATGKISWLAGSAHALYGIDGLYCRGRTLTATQNGASPARVVQFQLDSAHMAVIAERIIERGTTGASDVTHGVYVGNTFYYIANAGWDALDDQGVPKKVERETHTVLMRVGP